MPLAHLHVTHDQDCEQELLKDQEEEVEEEEVSIAEVPICRDDGWVVGLSPYHLHHREDAVWHRAKFPNLAARGFSDEGSGESCSNRTQITTAAQT